MFIKLLFLDKLNQVNFLKVNFTLKKLNLNFFFIVFFFLYKYLIYNTIKNRRQEELNL